MGVVHVVLAATAFGFGFRHGIDWDHIAAITDITSSQDTSRRSIFFATLYALGHGLVVFALGLAAIVLGERLPSGVDAIMERVVGLTLLLLGAYVFYALIRYGRDFRMRSRWMLVFSGVRRAARRLRRAAPPVVEVVHEHEHEPDGHHGDDPDTGSAVAATQRSGQVAVVTRHRHVHHHRATMPDDPFLAYGRATSFLVGMLHGVGAETPTQVLVFVAAAGAGGRVAGVLLLVAFVAGLLASNTLIAATSTVGFLNAARSFAVYAGVAVLTGTFSLVIGSMFLFGRSTLLPAIFGG